MKIFMFFLLFFASPPLFAQATFKVMTYNVENFFDTRDNPTKNDDEFLPSGNRYWTQSRYYHKLQQIAKVISAAGEWSTPALIALCEVENDSVLSHLTRRTPLRWQDYRYIITQSPDPRGINVALLYQRDQFFYLRHDSNSFFREQTQINPRYPTRIWKDHNRRYLRCFRVSFPLPLWRRKRK